MRSLVLIAVLGFCHAASIEERFLPLFASDSATADVSAKAGIKTESAASAHPVVVGPGSVGKKIQITIIKDFNTGDHGGKAGDHQATALKHGGHAGGHAAANGTAHHGGVHGHGAAAPVHAAPRLELNNQLQMDNATMQQMLQQLLTGNVQAMQTTGHPAVGHDANKPVAVIFSSALHVVDLGELVPPRPVTAAPAVAAHEAHAHAGHAGHAPANATHDHALAEHAALNATGLLDSIFKPLLSLTHMGHTTQQVVPSSVPQMPAMQAQAQMQMQPVIMMIPTGQLPFAAQQPMTVSSQAQVDAVLQSILSAKQQLLSESLAQVESASAAATHPVPAHPSPAVGAAHATAAAHAEGHTVGHAGHGTPVASFPMQKKKFGVVITKEVDGARRALD